MKKQLSLLLVLFAFGSRAADPVPKVTSVYAAAVTCFNGKIDDATWCSAHVGKVLAPTAGSRLSGGLTCGHPGKVSEIHWEFQGSEGNADIYQFTRRFPADAGTSETVTKKIRFEGKRLIIFEDRFQVIVIEPDLTAATKK